MQDPVLKQSETSDINAFDGYAMHRNGARWPMDLEDGYNDANWKGKPLKDFIPQPWNIDDGDNSECS